MIIQGSHAPCPIPYHTFFPNRMLISKLMHPLRLSKPTRPSLTLRKAPLFSPSLSSIVFTPPSVPPVLGDRNPQGREDVTALRCSEPLRYKVGGPSKVYARFMTERFVSSMSWTAL